MVTQTTRCVVWAKGAGRCHFCNQLLIGDLIAGNEDANFGFVAHIVGDKVTSPRGHPTRSALLADDPANLMLMCYPHHKLIDLDEVDDYPEERLLAMKTAHEERVRIQSGISADRASHILRYGAKIGELESPLKLTSVQQALVAADRYPADHTSIGIEILGSPLRDNSENFWEIERQNLEQRFDVLVRSRLANREISHLSVFALAPIPLLVKLGTLLGDISSVDIYQLHREPAGWRWAENGPKIDFKMETPASINKQIALKIGLSGTINDERIFSVLGKDTSIWSLSAAAPGNDVMRHTADLADFRSLARGLLDKIKAAHGEKAVINVFPAIPVSAAVELGRIRMPKADLPFAIFDQSGEAGFVKRLEILRQ